jgi:tRNA-dihydrouridine synthase A
MDGVMIGRAAYHTPADILGRADARDLRGNGAPGRSAEDAVLAMLPYIEDHLAHGREAQPDHSAHAGAVRGPSRGAGLEADPVGRAHRDGAGPDVVERALGEVTLRAA